MLEFRGDAICLSGLTGTKLKSEVIGEYYPFWWGITSGGKGSDYRYPTAIVELNAGTGEVYVEETGETVLGSAGHALELKVKNPQAKDLKVVLVEENPECYMHLKDVIERRWPEVSIVEAEGPVDQNSSNIYLLRNTLDEAIEVIRTIGLGNTIYFFDPLRSVEWNTIEKTAGDRMKYFYQTGTEFLIFVFTSDWFLGRQDFAPLPNTTVRRFWTKKQRSTVLEADRLFGNEKWRNHILNRKPIEEKERILVRLYRRRLYEWFRYVLPLPFTPKPKQLFHLVVCSNYEVGIRMTRNEYSMRTRNPRYSPNNKVAYSRFRKLHPELLPGLTGKERPAEWRILWRVISAHEGGRCDCRCSDLCEIAGDAMRVQTILEWLAGKRYLKEDKTRVAWKIEHGIKLYKLNWLTVKSNLGVNAPPPLVPLSTKHMSSSND